MKSVCVKNEFQGSLELHDKILCGKGRMEEREGGRERGKGGEGKEGKGREKGKGMGRETRFLCVGRRELREGRKGEGEGRTERMKE